MAGLLPVKRHMQDKESTESEIGMDKQTLKAGGLFTIDNEFIICNFSSPRTVLSTSSYVPILYLAGENPDSAARQRYCCRLQTEQYIPIKNYAKVTTFLQGEFLCF